MRLARNESPDNGILAKHLFPSLPLLMTEGPIVPVQSPRTAGFFAGISGIWDDRSEVNKDGTI